MRASPIFIFRWWSMDSACIYLFQILWPLFVQVLIKNYIFWRCFVLPFLALSSWPRSCSTGFAPGCHVRSSWPSSSDLEVFVAALNWDIDSSKNSRHHACHITWGCENSNPSAIFSLPYPYLPLGSLQNGNEPTRVYTEYPPLVPHVLRHHPQENWRWAKHGTKRVQGCYTILAGTTL